MELGFEPKTHSLEGCCSIQLSYSTKIGEDMPSQQTIDSPILKHQLFLGWDSAASTL